MSKRYPGNFITGNPVAVSQTSNNGIWDLKDQYQATGNNTWQEGDGIYEIGRSLRFRRSNSAYLSRTAVTPTDGRRATFSFWVKKGDVGVGTAESYRSIFYTGTPNSDGLRIGWARYEGYENNGIMITQDNGSSASHLTLFSTDVFRDSAAWYHFVIRYDSTDPIPNSRVKIFVNGREITSFTARTNPSLNHIPTWQTSGYTQKIGKGRDDVNEHADMYLTEVNFIDGQALDPSYFGYTDSITGIWYPKKYTGSYGTNGFYLPFTENQTLKNLGRNFAGNTNFAPYSESVASWGNTNCTVTSNSTTAPNGATTADTVAANSTAAAYMRIDTAINMGISTHYTMSVYLKAGTATTATLSDGYGTGANTTVNLTTGDVISSYNAFGLADATTVAVGNGWYRVILSFITHSGGDYNIGLRVDPGRTYGGTGANGASVYVWGAQINLGKTADAYFSNDVSTRADSNWTTNNISLTAGTTYDLMVDSPTNVFTSATDIGGVVPGNYATLSDLVPQTNSSLTDGNLQWFNQSGVGTSYAKPASFWGPGKWYFEVSVTNGSATSVMDTGAIGVMIYDPATIYASRSIGYGSGDFVWRYDGNRVTSGTATSYGTAVNSNSDVVMCAYDTSNNTVWFGKNGTWFASSNPATATSPAFTDSARPQLEYLFKPIVHSTHGGGGTAVNVVNFGQRQFAYTPPAGFKSLCTTNLQAVGTSVIGTAGLQPNKWFDTSLYGGSNGDIRVQNAGFQPDFIWIKSRQAQGHALVNSIGGGGEILQSNTASTPLTGITKPLIFNSDGFTSTTDIHTNGYGYAAWQWKQSPISGLNIVSWTGDGTNNRAISHNLGVAPAMIIAKDLTVGYNWDIYHSSLGISATHIFTSSNTRNFSAFGSTTPTASNFFTQNNYTNSNGSRLIAYVFAEVRGFSKFGSMTGNGSTDGAFVYTGFRPRFILMKGSDANQWTIWDSSRLGYNPFQAALFPNANSAEEAGASGSNSNGGPDFLSNGFKMRSNGGSNNLSGVTYIYAAFAESPFGLNNRAR